MNVPDTKPAADRRTKRREQTRARLIESAKSLFARQGVDLTRINEITEQADVGFGTFYNHFESKEAIVEAVLGETAVAHAEKLTAISAAIDDPAEVISVANRHFVRLAREDPEWAWLVIRLDLSHEVLLNWLAPYARRDLKRAIKAGRLDVADIEVTLFAAGGALLGVMRAVLEDRVGDDADVQHAACVLRLYGLPAEDAAEVAARPMPELPDIDVV